MAIALTYRWRYAWVKFKTTWRFLTTAKVRNGRTALHCMFQNEAVFLPEWLEYHLNLGFDQIFLTNDESKDGYQEVLKPYLKDGRVKLEQARQDLDFFTREEWHKNQMLKSLRGNFQWVAFLDADEFIWTEKGDLKAFLKDKEHWPGVVLNSFFYGTSGLEKLGEGEKLTEKLTQRFVDSHHEHQLVKSLVQPAYGFQFFYKNPHYPQYSPLARLRQVDGARFHPAQPRILREPASINHYWYRTERYYREQKRPRRAFFQGAPRKAHVEAWHHQAANAKEDPRLAKQQKAWQERREN